MRGSRVRRGLHLCAVLVLVLGLVALWRSAAPASALGAPVRVGLTGDSIVEDGGVTSSRGLGGALRSELRRRGYDATGWGYVPAHGSDLRLEADGTVAAAPWRYAGAWAFLGLTPFFDPASPIPHELSSPFGADGHAVESASNLAVGTASISGERFAVEFVRAPDAGRFRFSVDGRARIVNANATAVDGGGIAWLTAPRYGLVAHTVRVSPLSGTLRFTGLLSERASRPVRARVEVLSLGRSCACASDGFPPGQQQALAALRLDVTVIMFGTNDQAKLEAADDEATRDSLVAGLVARGTLARRHGGTCLIVPPAPNPRPPAIQHDVRALEHHAATAAGCRYAPVLKHLWTATGSVAAGSTLDGIHPTAAGYRLMASALATEIARAVRAP